MKRVLITILCLWSVAYGQLCADTDTVRATSASQITAVTARINGTTSHFSGSVVSIQLKYVRVGHTDTVTSSGTSALRNLTGLQPATQYVYYYKSICGSGSVSQTIGAYTFTTLANTILYVDERPTRFYHAKVDSSFGVPSGDTVVGREPSTFPQIRYKSSNQTFYGYYPSPGCACWRPLAIDSAGIIGLLDGKVDSVTVSGDSLFYWKVGVSYGYILPSLNNVWRNTGNTGIDTSVNWLGTNDNKALVIRTNNTRRLILDQAGRIIQPDSLIWDLNNHDLYFYTNGKQVNFEADDPGDVVIHMHALGDIAERLQIQADGHLEWGNGSGIIDVGLTRIDTSNLQLNGNTGNDTKLSIDVNGPGIDSGMIQFTHASTNVDGRLYYDHPNNVMGITTSGSFKWTLGSDATGDIWYRNSSGFMTRLPIGTTKQTLHVVGGVPAWRDTAVASGGSLAIGSTVTSATAGGIFFAGTGGTLQQKISDFFYDSANNRLGIGTNSPQYPIHLLKTQNAATRFVVENQSSGSSAFASFDLARSFGADYYATFAYANESSGIFTPLSLNITTASGSTGGIFMNAVASAPIGLSTNNTRRMTITGAGDVGIGNTSPGEKLEVTGNVKASGKIIARNIIYQTTNATDADFTAAQGTAYVLPDNSVDRTITLPASPADGDIIRFYLPLTPSFSWEFNIAVKLPDNTTYTRLGNYPNSIQTIQYDGANSVWRAEINQ